MQYNLHPLLVHFPLALLTLYGVFEIIRLPVITRQNWWFPVKAVLVILGTISLYPTALAGSLTEDLLRGKVDPRLVDMHSTFATATIIVFSVIALIYLLAAIKPQFRLWANGKLIVLLALLGVILLTVTGALGGAIVYGPAAEPLSSAIYHLLFR